MGRIWDVLTGFLAYVHAMSSLIPTYSSSPLTNSKLIKIQEEALDFYFGLHKDAENYVKNFNERQSTNNFSQESWINLSFENKVQQSLDEILNTTSGKDKKAWLYIELWMIKYRPELYRIATKKKPMEFQIHIAGSGA
ncbi:hypothetical protein BY996DRAFT_7873454 [Phakopsora pachyrhizi]|nr:hypothetical protein BY996DRAFT_7873454 [Phakopsora pachyrhizi]